MWFGLEVLICVLFFRTMFTFLKKDDVSLATERSLKMYVKANTFIQACETETNSCGPLCQQQCYASNTSQWHRRTGGQGSQEVCGVLGWKPRSICKLIAQYDTETTPTHN